MILITSQGFGDIVKTVEGLKDGTPRAIMRALNRSIAAAQTVEVRAVSSDTGMKQAEVRKALTLNSATPNKLRASLAASMVRLKLIAFNPRGNEPSRGKGRGVTYKFQGSKGRVPDAFITTLQSGHRGVFKRFGPSTKKSPGAWSKNLPILELEGPSIGHVFIKYRDQAQARAQEVFTSRFEHEISGAWNGTPVPSDPGTADVGAE